MKRHLLVTTSLVAGLLTGCGKEDDTCGDGYARADDGNCYPINAEGDEDADGGTTDADGSATDADGSAADIDGGTPDIDGGPLDDGPPDGGDFDDGDFDDGGLDDGGPIDDTGSAEITADCADGALPGTTASGSVRDWTGGGAPITFSSAAWYWDPSSNTATVLISDSADSCGDIITQITDSTYTGAATSLVISDWTDLGPGSIDVLPMSEASPGDVNVVASAYYHDGSEGGSWPLDGFTGTVDSPTYGSLTTLYIGDGARFEASVQLYGADASEGVDGNFEACYCTDLSSLVVPGETIGEGGDGPPVEPDSGPLDGPFDEG